MINIHNFNINLSINDILPPPPDPLLEPLLLKKKSIVSQAAMAVLAVAVAVGTQVGTPGKTRPGQLRRKSSSSTLGKKDGQLPGRVEVGKIGKRTIEW